MTKEQHDSLLRSNAELVESNKMLRNKLTGVTQELMTLRNEKETLIREKAAMSKLINNPDHSFTDGDGV